MLLALIGLDGYGGHKVRFVCIAPQLLHQQRCRHRTGEQLRPQPKPAVTDFGL